MTHYPDILCQLKRQLSPFVSPNLRFVIQVSTPSSFKMTMLATVSLTVFVPAVTCFARQWLSCDDNFFKREETSTEVRIKSTVAIDLFSCGGKWLLLDPEIVFFKKRRH